MQQGADEDECAHDDADDGNHFFQDAGRDAVGQLRAGHDTGELGHRDQKRHVQVDETIGEVADGAGSGSRDLDDLAGGDGGEGGESQDDHEGHGQHGAAHAGQARAESHGGADEQQLQTLPAVTGAVGDGAAFGGEQGIDAREDDDAPQDEVEDPGRCDGVGQGPGVAAHKTAYADGYGDAPVDAAVFAVQPGTQKPGKDEAEQGRGHGRMGRQAAKAAQGGDQQDAAHAYCSDEAADDEGDGQEDNDHGLLRCDVVHKLSKQRAKEKNNI